MYQRNIARTYPGAGSTFNTISQIIFFGIFVVAGFAVPIELLRQQLHRTDFRTFTAADAVHLVITRRQFRDAWRK